jgi:hypothetical protein
MPSPFIGGRIPQELHEALQNHIAESGEKLPQILQRALSSYLSYTPPVNKSHTGLEERIAFIEASFNSLKEKFEQMKQASPSVEKKEEDTLPGQLSFLDGDNVPDNRIDIKEDDDIKSVIVADNSRENSSDDNSDNDLDIREDDSNKQLETITPQELAERTGMSIGTLQNYKSTRREVKRDGLIYRPVLGTKKGKPLWSVEVSNR